MAQNWDKLAIVLSVAVIALALMAQTTFANGAAQANSSDNVCDASPTLDECIETDDDNGSDDVCDASPTLDQCIETDDDNGSDDVCDASPTLDQCIDPDDDDFEIAHATDTDDKPVPPGQFKRRGIFGTVAATGSDDTGTYVILETKFGNVTVYTSDVSDFEAGDRFSALLDKSPFDATETTDSFRTATALRAKRIPGKSSRGHLRSLVVDSSSGTDDEDTLTILDEDGNEIVLVGGASGTLDGEDTILLIQTLTDGQPPRVLGGITAFSVGKRLEKLLEKGSPEQLARLNDLIQKRVERNEARLQRIEDNAPDHLRGTVRGARDQNQGRGRNTGDDDGDKGKPDERASPTTRASRTSNRR
ncbi:MAG: hypothetical protein IIC94_06305 [Chloroflexi bacterium]|nr:hypothetical protein [Chloroflexota bacterium]